MGRIASMRGLRRSKVRACLCEGSCKTRSSFLFFSGFVLFGTASARADILSVLMWNCKGIVNVAQQWRSHRQLEAPASMSQMCCQKKKKKKISPFETPPKKKKKKKKKKS